MFYKKKIIIGRCMFLFLVLVGTFTSNTCDESVFAAAPEKIECVSFLPGCGNFRIGTGDPTENKLFEDIIPNLMSWLYSLAAAIAVLMGVVSGTMFLFAGGSDELRGRATKTLTYAIVGLIVALFAYFIVALINILPFPGTT